MKDKYFRIIELPDHDVLLEKDWDEETNNPLCSVIFHVEGIRVAQKLGYETEEQRDKAFDEITAEQAQTVVNGVLSLIQGE